MTVGELRKALEGIPDDRICILSSDQEGNSYREANVTARSQAIHEPGQYSMYEWQEVNPDDVTAGEYEGLEILEVVVLW